jgi:hypothetical protein
MSYGKTGKDYWAEATVTIMWYDVNPLDGATVYGTFSGATSDSVSGITNGDGQVTLASSTKRNGGTWTFCVDDVTHPCSIYLPYKNIETCDSITAP